MHATDNQDKGQNEVIEKGRKIIAIVGMAALGWGTGPACAGDGACGSILCLAGGSTVLECSGTVVVSECGGYLSQFYAQDTADSRRNFLNSCQGSDASFNDSAAMYGVACSPGILTASLNQEITTCEDEYQRCIGLTGNPFACPKCPTPSPTEPEQRCGAWNALLGGNALKYPTLRQRSNGSYYWQCPA
jgi:hypothetical protein